MVYSLSYRSMFLCGLIERVEFMFGDNRSYSSPYDYPSAHDYYQAVEEYQKWQEDMAEAEAEAIDLAYERSLEEKWDNCVPQFSQIWRNTLDPQDGQCCS